MRCDATTTAGCASLLLVPTASCGQPVLTGPNVRLRPLTGAVLSDYLTALADPEVARLTGTRTPFTPAQVEEWLRTRADHHDRADWSIHRASDDTFLGEAVLNNVDLDNASANYRVWLGGEGLLGRGYGTETTRLVIDHAFAQLGLHRVSLEVFEHNTRARRVYEKCGFRLEGRLREALWWDGGRHDVLVMGVLSTDPRPAAVV